MFVAVVVVSRSRGRSSGLRRLGRRVSARSFFSKYIGSGVLQRGLGEKTVSVRRGRGRVPVVVFDGLRRLGCRASAKSFFQISR